MVNSRGAIMRTSRGAAIRSSQAADACACCFTTLAVVDRKGTSVWLLRTDTGANVWTTTVTGIIDNSIRSVGIDNNGNVIVAQGAAATSTHKLYKLSGVDGSVLWSVTTTVTYPMGQDGNNIAVDSANNIFFDGKKYSTTDGSVLWSVAGISGGSVDSSGNFYARINRQTIRSYNTSGTQRWNGTVDQSTGAPEVGMNTATIPSGITLTNQIHVPSESPPLSHSVQGFAQDGSDLFTVATESSGTIQSIFGQIRAGNDGLFYTWGEQRNVGINLFSMYVVTSAGSITQSSILAAVPSRIVADAAGNIYRAYRLTDAGYDLQLRGAGGWTRTLGAAGEGVVDIALAPE